LAVIPAFPVVVQKE